MIFIVNLFDFDDFITAMLRYETRGVWDKIRYVEKCGGRELVVTRLFDTQHFEFQTLLHRVPLNPSEPIWLPAYDANTGEQWSTKILEFYEEEEH